MVARGFLFALTILTVSGANAGGAASNRPVVSTIVIEKNGAWSEHISSDETPEFCSEFRLSESDIMDFFNVARDATEREYEHDLSMSRCYASGRVTFKNGKQALWKIDRERRGRLVFPDKAEQYFYCADCKSKVYDEACDDACLNE